MFDNLLDRGLTGLLIRQAFSGPPNTVLKGSALALLCAAGRRTLFNDSQLLTPINHNGLRVQPEVVLFRCVL